LTGLAIPNIGAKENKNSGKMSKPIKTKQIPHQIREYLARIDPRRIM
jgi:hypothetical protein